MLLDCAMKAGLMVAAVVDVHPDLVGKKIGRITVEHEDTLGLKYKKSKYLLVNGVGHTDKGNHSENVYESWRNGGLGWSFATLIHPSADISPSAKIGHGAQILSGAVINAKAVIGHNTTINTGAIIEHDCVIGDSVHVAPNATICGGSEIGDRTFVGCGATVIQGKKVGQACMIAAGSVLTGDLYAGSRVAGVPARLMRGEGLMINTFRHGITSAEDWR